MRPITSGLFATAVVALARRLVDGEMDYPSFLGLRYRNSMRWAALSTSLNHLRRLLILRKPEVRWRAGSQGFHLLSLHSLTSSASAWERCWLVIRRSPVEAMKAVGMGRHRVRCGSNRNRSHSLGVCLYDRKCG